MVTICESKNRLPIKAFCGIDIASLIHVISALDFSKVFFIKMKPAPNTQEAAILLEGMIVDVLKENN